MLPNSLKVKPIVLHIEFFPLIHNKQLNQSTVGSLAIHPSWLMNLSTLKNWLSSPSLNFFCQGTRLEVSAPGPELSSSAYVSWSLHHVYGEHCQTLFFFIDTSIFGSKNLNHRYLRWKQLKLLSYKTLGEYYHTYIASKSKPLFKIQNHVLDPIKIIVVNIYKLNYMNTCECVSRLWPSRLLRVTKFRFFVLKLGSFILKQVN